MEKAKGDAKFSLDTTRRFQIEFIPKRSLAFNYGDAGDKYYIVISGKLEVWIPIMNEEKTKIDVFRRVMTYSPGGSFGELALI